MPAPKLFARRMDQCEQNLEDHYFMNLLTTLLQWKTLEIVYPFFIFIAGKRILFMLETLTKVFIVLRLTLRSRDGDSFMKIERLCNLHFAVERPLPQ